MLDILTNGIKTIIDMIPEKERPIFIEMLDTFNPLDRMDKKYLIPFELYCYKCGIPFCGYDNENIKASILRLDIGITQLKDGTIIKDAPKKMLYRYWHLLGRCVIDNNLDVIEYTLHELLYPYILAYHIEKSG